MNFSKALELYKAEPTIEKAKSLAAELAGEMTSKEKVRMLRGHAMGVTVKNTLKNGRFYNAEPYPAGGCARLKIPEILFTDGPRGIVLRHSTCFPVSMLRGAAFDDELEYRVGEVFAKEASAGGANLAKTLGITVEQLGMKCGMFIGMLFPLIAIFLYLHLLRTRKKKNSIQ
jgi:hypothetical protein